MNIQRHRRHSGIVVASTDDRTAFVAESTTLGELLERFDEYAVALDFVLELRAEEDYPAELAAAREAMRRDIERYDELHGD